MTAQKVGGEAKPEYEGVPAGAAEPMEKVALPNKFIESSSFRGPLPWIGALSNPHVVTMLVVNDSGYLVPLCTAADLLRGCKMIWHQTQD